MGHNTKKSFYMKMLDKSVAEQLQGTLKDIEKNLGIEGLGSTLYNVIMELAGNAVKANIKRVYFKKNGYRISDPLSYAEGILAFSQDVKNTNTSEYEKALEELELNVAIDVDLTGDRLLIQVENNLLLLEEEEKRIRTKLAEAMGTKDIVKFYVQFGDETEGRGLGLAMVVLLIKDLGFNPENFRVFHKGSKTVARIEFPLTANYVPLRERTGERLNIKQGPFKVVRQPEETTPLSKDS